MIDLFLKHWNYWVYIAIMMVGFYGLLAKNNLVKKVIGLGIFQTAIFLLFISMAVVRGGVAPIVDYNQKEQVYANPVPHVLILTAIVVSVSVTAVALAVIINIKREYGTVEIDEIDRLEGDA